MSAIAIDLGQSNSGIELAFQRAVALIAKDRLAASAQNRGLAIRSHRSVMSVADRLSRGAVAYGEA